MVRCIPKTCSRIIMSLKRYRCLCFMLAEPNRLSSTTLLTLLYNGYDAQVEHIGLTIDTNLAQLSVKGATLLALITICGNLFQLFGCASNTARSSQLGLLNASLSGFFTQSALDPAPCNSSFLCANAVNKFIAQNEELALLWLPVSCCSLFRG